MILYGKKIALFSASGGATILIGFLISRADFLVGTGLIYLAIATVVNLLILTAVAIEFFRFPTFRKDFLITTGCLLANIPFGLLCCLIALKTL